MAIPQNPHSSPTLTRAIPNPGEAMQAKPIWSNVLMQSKLSCLHRGYFGEWLPDEKMLV